MTEVFVVGGQQRSIDTERTDEWHFFKRALIVALDLETGELREVASWTSPPEACPETDPSILFKAGTLDVPAGRFWVPTNTEVLTYEYPSFRQIGYVSIPCFNDLHHVAPSGSGSLLVTCTGLDMVVEITPDGTVLREWPADDGELWTRFSRDVDYRRVPTTKPHVAHPNFTFQLDGEIWATRCGGSEAVCLTGQGRMKVGHLAIHDGHVVGRRVIFTQVNGQVIEVGADTRAVQRVHDLTGMLDGMPVGWCRGIEVLDDDLYLVGFSRLRPTKWKEYVQWLKKGLGGAGTGLAPTRLVAWDGSRNAALWEAVLESVGMNAIFSVHAPDPAAVRDFIRRQRPH